MGSILVVFVRIVDSLRLLFFAWLANALSIGDKARADIVFG